MQTPAPAPRSQASGRSGPRTRTGCLTCRRRKVRCDRSSASTETQSRCGNCARLELECHFAPPDSPRKRPRRGYVNGSGSSMPPRTETTRVNDENQYGGSPTQQVVSNDASTPVLSPPIPIGSQQPHYVPPPDVPLFTDQMSLDRVFGDDPDFSGFPNLRDWSPVALSPGMMPPIPGFYTSSLLPWNDFTGGGVEVTASSGNQPDAVNAYNNKNSRVTYRQQPHDTVPRSPTSERPRQRSTPTTPSAGIDLALFDVSEHQRLLLLHFTPKANPIPLISPTDSQWKSAYSSLIGMACGCSHLINAICAVSELNLAGSKRGSVSRAFAYYQSATAKGEAVLNFSSARVDDRLLKQAFATLLLLMHAEIMAQPLAGHHAWPTTRLRTAHRHLRRHSERLRLWTGIGSHVLSWIQIVHSKAIYSAGMEKETDGSPAEFSNDTPPSPNGTTIDASPFGQPSPAADHSVHLSPDFRAPPPHTPISAHEKPADSPLEEPLSAAEIAYDALYESAYKFFMRCQSFIPRIIALDPHHRPRGPLDNELEVLQLGQRLRGELRDLWANRPQSLNVLDDTDGLQEVLHPRVALKVIRSFRSFVANFHAVRIFLHRVAFIQYPASEEVRHAIAEILRLARDQIADDGDQAGVTAGTDGGRRTQEPQRDGSSSRDTQNDLSVHLAREPPQPDNECQDGQDDNANSNHWTPEEAPPATGGPFPIMLWLWPLFMCGTECGAEERRWVLERMYAMRSVNAERTAILLAEVTRLQDETGRRVDQRSIRQKIFADEFDVVY